MRVCDPDLIKAGRSEVSVALLGNGALLSPASSRLGEARLAEPGFIKAGRSEVSVWLRGIGGELSPASPRPGDVRRQV